MFIEFQGHAIIAEKVSAVTRVELYEVGHSSKVTNDRIQGHSYMPALPGTFPK